MQAWRSDCELQNIQMSSRTNDLFALYSACRSRYVRAADLLEISRDKLGPLSTLGVTEFVDLADLVESWTIVCGRYEREMHDAQATLFANPEKHTATQWSSFVHHWLIPLLLRDDEFVRDLLRVVSALPCRDKKKAADAINAKMTNMALPDAPLPWSAEEA